MHTKPMVDSDGAFNAWTPSAGACRKCGQMKVRCRSWESSCGGYEDYQYECAACGNSWWIDGPDA